MYVPLIVTGAGLTAYLDTQLVQSPTVCHKSCELLVTQIDTRCTACTQYRKSLRAICSHQSQEKADNRTAPDSHTNYRYLSTPEKGRRLSRLHSSARSAKKNISRILARLAEITEQSGVVVDRDTHDDMVLVMQEHTTEIHQNHPPESFARLFWDQQQRASSVASSSAMKWHPLMIKWCIYLRHLSSSSYEALRQSGCISLPSQRTLRDYTHFANATAGFSVDTDRQLLNAMEIEKCPEWKKCVVLLMDEMHIKADLVYDKFSGKNFKCTCTCI